MPESVIRVIDAYVFRQTQDGIIVESIDELVDKLKNEAKVIS